MFVSRLKTAGTALALAALCTASASAQTATAKHRARRESNAARQARIARTIEETYSHKYEVFGGGGFMRFRSGDFTKKNNEVTWQASGAYNFNPRWAAIADARGMFGYANATINNIYGVAKPQINEYTFMGGGSYRFIRHEKLAVSAQGLAGIGWGIFSGGSKGIPSVDLGIWPDGFKPAFSLGISADYNVDPKLALRITPTYVATTFGSSVQNNLGINFGVVYRFGKK